MALLQCSKHPNINFKIQLSRQQDSHSRLSIDIVCVFISDLFSLNIIISSLFSLLTNLHIQR